MNTEYLQMYFERSNALQNYWTLYVVILGGLLAFSALRKEKDFITTALVTILYVCFAYKNLGAIHDVTLQRAAIMQVARLPVIGGAGPILDTLIAPDWEGTRNFHVFCDVLTVLAIWAMELRRRKHAHDIHPAA